MAEQSISNARAILLRGEQKKLLDKILKRISIQSAAQVSGLSFRTIRDWRREKFTMDLKSIRLLCRKAEIVVPVNLTIRERYWYVNNGSSAGGLAVLKKYGRIGGDPEYRKRKWYEWWEREGRRKYGFIGVCKSIQKPPRSEELAEFVGIILGDGCISQRQIVVTLHATDDKEYGEFVCSLIKKLFKVPVVVSPDKKYAAVDFVISRSELVRFCIEKLGLKKGSKVRQQVDIPDWVRRNKKYSIACVRGLVDTDGCIFTHRYKVNEKIYSYKKLSFTNHSLPLRQSVFEILKDLGLRVRLANAYDVRIDAKKDMEKYFQIVGSHNPKHLKRYKN